MLAGFTLDDGPAAVLKAARIVANVSARGFTIVASSTSSASMISSASMSILLGAHPAGVFCTDGGRSTYPRRGSPAAMPVSADNGANGKVLASLSASIESVEPTGHESLFILLCGMVPSEYSRTLRSMSAVTSGAAPGGTSNVIVDGLLALDVPLWMYRTTSMVSPVTCHPASSVNSHRLVTRSVRGSRSARPHTSTYATRSRVDSGRPPENDATSPHGTASDVLMSRPGPPPPRAVQTGEKTYKTALGRP